MLIAWIGGFLFIGAIVLLIVNLLISINTQQTVRNMENAPNYSASYSSDGSYILSKTSDGFRVWNTNDIFPNNWKGQLLSLSEGNMISASFGPENNIVGVSDNGDSYLFTKDGGSYFRPQKIGP